MTTPQTFTSEPDTLVLDNYDFNNDAYTHLNRNGTSTDKIKESVGKASSPYGFVRNVAQLFGSQEGDTSAKKYAVKTSFEDGGLRSDPTDPTKPFEKIYTNLAEFNVAQKAALDSSAAFTWGEENWGLNDKDVGDQERFLKQVLNNNTAPKGSFVQNYTGVDFLEGSMWENNFDYRGVKPYSAGIRYIAKPNSQPPKNENDMRKDQISMNVGYPYPIFKKPVVKTCF